MSTPLSPQSTRRTFWALAAFYGLIACEFFYMASPFALYFYSVYRPGLNFINRSSLLAWLSGSFLPHFVETRAGPLNALAGIGAALFLLGMLSFCLGAVQVYSHKLARKGAVLGGVYRFIRHPQYAALALSSFGLLLLWPRFIVLVSFVTMLFAYYFLARLEEGECATKFGPAYIAYQQRTGMFLPWQAAWPDRIAILRHLPALPAGGPRRAAAILGLWATTCALAVGAATGLQRWTLNSLYAHYTPGAAYLSVAPLEAEQLEQIIAIALADPWVRLRVVAPGTVSLNYILPLTWYDSEIPMRPVTGQRGHSHPAGYDTTRYRIIFTRLKLHPWAQAQGQEILRNIEARTPLLEIVIDLEQGRVVDIQEPVETQRYDGVPVPVY